MRIENAPVNNVYVTPELAEDEMHVALRNERIYRKVQKYLKYFEDEKTFPNSFRPHKADDYGMWIGWVSVGPKAWRILFDYDFTDGTLLLLRLLNHEEMDTLWKTF